MRPYARIVPRVWPHRLIKIDHGVVQPHNQKFPSDIVPNRRENFLLVFPVVDVPGCRSRLSPNRKTTVVFPSSDGFIRISFGFPEIAGCI